VRKAVSDLKISYPVAVDNNYAIWRAFNNQYSPAHYFIDAKGQIRHHHFGEGGYDASERVIQQLLTEAGTAAVSTDLVSVHAAGVEAAPDLAEVQSPETYVGYERAEPVPRERLASGPGTCRRRQTRAVPYDDRRRTAWQESRDGCRRRWPPTRSRSSSSIPAYTPTRSPFTGSVRSRSKSRQTRFGRHPT
jgi:hypothetical protein